MKIFFCPGNWQLITTRVWAPPPLFLLRTHDQWQVYCPRVSPYIIMALADVYWCRINNKDVSIVNISRCFQWINEQYLNLIQRISETQRIHKIMNFTQLLSPHSQQRTVPGILWAGFNGSILHIIHITGIAPLTIWAPGAEEITAQDLVPWFWWLEASLK